MSLSKWAVAKRVAVPAVLAVGATASPFVQIAPAQAVVGTSSFTVNLYDGATGSSSVAGVNVKLIDTSNGSTVATGVSDANGNYEFDNLVAGSYVALAQDPNGDFFDGYSVERTLADNDTNGVAITLSPKHVTEGKLAGTVTEAGGNVDAYIEIYPATATQATIQSGAVHPIGHTWAIGSGSVGWSVNLPASSSGFKVEVANYEEGYTYSSSGYNRIWNDAVWIGSASSPTKSDDAHQYPVTATHTTTVATVAVPVSGTTTTPRITGTVTGAGVGAIGDVDVTVLAKLPDNNWTTVGNDETAADGTFGIDPNTTYDKFVEYCYNTATNSYEQITPGSDCASGQYYYTDSYVPLPSTTQYTLRFSDSHDEYVGQWLGGTAIDDWYAPPAGAATFTLATSTTKVSGKNATLAAAPFDKSSGLNGQLTDWLGAATTGRVHFFDLHGNDVNSVLSRRDGNWTEPISELPPGQYKVYFDTDSDEGGEWYGGTTYKGATTVTVGVTGAGVSLGKSGLNRLGKLSGTVTVPMLDAPGDIFTNDVRTSWVTIYDANGDQVASPDTSTNGAWSSKLAPGTYYVSAGGATGSSFDPNFYSGGYYSDNQATSYQPMITKFWKSSYFLGSAKPITVAGGKTTTGINVTLGDQLLATTKPKITGTKAVGKTLKASAGVWNDRKGVSFSYVWKRGSTKVGTGATHKVVKGDRGKTLTVTVTAKDTTATFTGGSSTSAGVKIPK